MFGRYLCYSSQSRLSTTTVRKCRTVPAILIYKTHLMLFSTYADNVKMVIDIPLPMNYVVVDQSALNLVDIWLDNTPHIM